MGIFEEMLMIKSLHDMFDSEQVSFTESVCFSLERVNWVMLSKGAIR